MLFRSKDAVLMKVCKDLALDAKVQVVYGDFLCAGPLICDKIIPHGDYSAEDYDWADDIKWMGGRLVRPLRWKVKDIPVISVNWVTPVTTKPATNSVESHLAQHFGNQPGMGHQYGNFCLLVEITRS